LSNCDHEIFRLFDFKPNIKNIYNIINNIDLIDTNKLSIFDIENK